MDQRMAQSGRRPNLTPAQSMDFIEFLHTQPEAFFTKQQLAHYLSQRYGISYSPHYLPAFLRQLGLKCIKPRPQDMRRSADAPARLQQRLQATFEALSMLGYDLQQVAFGCADESSPQIHANTARLWSVGYGVRVVNAAKIRCNTFGFYALQGHDLCRLLPDSSEASFLALIPQIRQANADYQAVVLLWDNLPAHCTKAVVALARQHQIFIVNNLPYAPDLNPIESIWKQIKRRISVQGLIRQAQLLEQMVIDSFYELAQSTSFAKSWIEKILLPAIPPNCAISFCQHYS
jgi:transposase